MPFGSHASETLHSLTKARSRPLRLTVIKLRGTGFSSAREKPRRVDRGSVRLIAFTNQLDQECSPFMLFDRFCEGSNVAVVYAITAGSSGESFRFAVVTTWASGTP